MNNLVEEARRHLVARAVPRHLEDAGPPLESLD